MAKKKRYYQSKRDRRNESRGMKDYYEKERIYMAEDGYYKMDPRRRRELEDSAMIREDHNAPANLPQYVSHKYWNGGHYGLNPDLNDTARGADMQMEADARKMFAHLGEDRYRNIP